MKKIINILFIVFSFAAYSSCTPEEADIFSDSSANRMESAIAESMDILTGATNGWLIEYYPASAKQYGGYNLLVSFSKDGMATVSGDSYDPEEKSTSSYSIKQSAGVILSFDTYNKVMHYFSDPKNPDGIGINGKGMEGDLEFVLMEVTKEKITLQGRKTRNIMTMIPFSENENWVDYLKEVNTADEAYSELQNFNYEQGDFTAKATISYRCMTITYNVDDNEVSVTAPFIITKEGTFKFYEPLVLNNVSIDGLKFIDTGELGVFVPTNGVEATFTPYFPLNQQFFKRDWYFGFSTMGTFGKPYWNYVLTNVMPRLTSSLEYICFTPYSGVRIAFYWYCGGTAYLFYDCRLSGNEQITFSFASSGNALGVSFWNTYSWNYMTNPFHNRTFKISANDLVNPTELTLSDINNANNVIKVFKEEILDPFNK